MFNYLNKCLFFDYFHSIFQSNSSSGVLNGHETDSACEEDIFDDDIKGQLISKGHFGCQKNRNFCKDFCPSRGLIKKNNRWRSNIIKCHYLFFYLTSI